MKILAISIAAVIVVLAIQLTIEIRRTPPDVRKIIRDYMRIVCKKD